MEQALGCYQALDVLIDVVCPVTSALSALAATDSRAQLQQHGMMHDTAAVMPAPTLRYTFTPALYLNKRRGR